MTVAHQILHDAGYFLKAMASVLWAPILLAAWRVRANQIIKADKAKATRLVIGLAAGWLVSLGGLWWTI